MKSLQETIAAVEVKKRQLEDDVDMLQEKVAAAAAAGELLYITVYSSFVAKLVHVFSHMLVQVFVT